MIATSVAEINKKMNIKLVNSGMEKNKDMYTYIFHQAGVSQTTV